MDEMRMYLDAIEKLNAEARAMHIADTATAAQGQGKNIDKAIKDLLK